jgi:hypothetical protein
MISRRTTLGAVVAAAGGVMAAPRAPLLNRPRPGSAAEENRTMFPLDLKRLTPEQRAMVDLWE